jgi:hypothetical protein
MIYRILTDAFDEYWDKDRQIVVRRSLRMIGVGSTLGGLMWELHLPAPDFDNERARFWFTERGWDRFGRKLASEGQRAGHVVKVIRRKNPKRSQIVYADEWQMALLPVETARRRDGKTASREP